MTQEIKKNKQRTTTKQNNTKQKQTHIQIKTKDTDF